MLPNFPRFHSNCAARYLIIGSDGLWQSVSPEEAVCITSELITSDGPQVTPVSFRVIENILVGSMTILFSVMNTLFR